MSAEINNRTSTMIYTLAQLIEGKTLTSMDINVVNAPQYFCTIKNNGIELIEVSKPNLLNRGHHLERRLNPSDENVEKAKNYLDKLKGIV